MFNDRITPGKLLMSVVAIVVISISALLISASFSSYNGIKKLFESTSEIPLDQSELNTYGADEIGYFSSDINFESYKNKSYGLSEVYSSEELSVVLIDVKSAMFSSVSSNVRDNIDGMVELPKESENLLNTLYNSKFFVEKVSIGGSNGILCSQTEESSQDDLAREISSRHNEKEESIYYLSESGKVIGVVGNPSMIASAISGFKEFE